MHSLIHRLNVVLALSTLSLAAQAASLESAISVLGADKVKTVTYSGTGQWYQFGQAPAPNLSWPPFDVSRYVASVDYSRPAARVQIDRLQVIDPKRQRPVPVVQKVDQYVSETIAWSLGVAPALPVFTAQPAAVEERVAEIWSTPQGFLKAARDNGASSKKTKGGVEVSFAVGNKYRYVGLINQQDQVTQVSTWIDNPVLGDTEIQTRFSEYRDFGGVPFPTKVQRIQGGHPVLKIAIQQVEWDAPIDIQVPEVVANAPVPPVAVQAEQLAEGVYYLRGGTHHSVAIEQKRHVVVVEAPLNELRSQAVIDKVKELVPGKPIKFLINTHAHFDHSGGLRTYVDEGAKIVTHKGNVAYYQKAWSRPHRINPDRLSQSGKKPAFVAFSDKHVLKDDDRPVVIHSIAGNTHNDAFALVYLPHQGILVEADAYTPLAANAPQPTTVNPFSLNLLSNIEKRKLHVERIAALHGPGVVTLDDLRRFVNKPAANR